MKNDKLNIDKLFTSETFKDLEVDFSSKRVWKGINKKLFWSDFLKFSFKSFNVYYSAVIISVVSFTAITINNSTLQNTNEPKIIEVKKETKQTEKQEKISLPNFYHNNLETIDFQAEINEINENREKNKEDLQNIKLKPVIKKEKPADVIIMDTIRETHVVMDTVKPTPFIEKDTI